MGISRYHSTVTLAPLHKPYPTIIEYLAHRFPHVPFEVWEERMKLHKLHDENGRDITHDTAYRPFMKVRYYREIAHETHIPFAEEILFENEDMLIADKPHFLPVIPRGSSVNECLLNRLRERTSISELTPMHRLDRQTAGLVLFSKRQQTRKHYTDLFRNMRIRKTYHAIAVVSSQPRQRTWIVQNRIVRGEPWFRMKIHPGTVNTCTSIALQKIVDGLGYFELIPFTGKTHQLRVHMHHIGFPILHDTYYPDYIRISRTDFSKPLQLLAKRLVFIDPVKGKQMEFESKQNLFV